MYPPEGEKTPRESLPERAKTPRQSLPERAKTPGSQLSVVISVFTQECSKEIKVGARLQKFAHVWEQRGVHPHQLALLTQGYKLPFITHPHLSRSPCVISGYTNLEKDDALAQTIQDLLHKGAIEPVRNKHSLSFYSRLFLVPKPGNRWRPVIDLSALNKFLDIPKFKMETPESIRASIRKGEWVTSLDLTDAYLHVPIHLLSRKFLRFHHRGQTYQFLSLPFGLATAPLVFTKLVKEVKLMALAMGIRMHQYLDDWLLRAPSCQEASKHTALLLQLVQDLGFIINHKKSELNPSQNFDFVGYHYMLDRGPSGTGGPRSKTRLQHCHGRK